MRSRFGVNLGHSVPWPEIQRNARAVEDAGFDSLWFPDHLANPYADTAWLECWTILAAVAAVTKRIRLGPLVSSTVYRHPALLAKQAITIDRISDGRVMIGLGAGGNPHCHTIVGEPVWAGKERQDRFAEYVMLLDRLLTNERTDYRGSYYSSEGAVRIPGPVQSPRPPFLIAAHGPRALDVAARYGDSWNLFTVSPELTGQDAADAVSRMNELVSEKALAAGRDPDAITRSLTVGFAPFSSWKSLDEAASQIEMLEKAGINEFIFPYSPPGDSEESRREFAKIVEAGVSVLLDSERNLRALAEMLKLS